MFVFYIAESFRGFDSYIASGIPLSHTPMVPHSSVSQSCTVDKTTKTGTYVPWDLHFLFLILGSCLLGDSSYRVICSLDSRTMTMGTLSKGSSILNSETLLCQRRNRPRLLISGVAVRVRHS